MVKTLNPLLLFSSSALPVWSRDGQSWSYAQLRHAVEAFKRSVEWPDRGTAVLTAQPTFDFLVKFLSLLELGLPQAVLPADLPLAQQIEHARLLGDSYQFSDDESVVWLNESGTTVVAANCALVLFTSGSAGHPKGVQLSWQNIEAASEAICASLDFHAVKQQWLLLNLHYSFGLLGQLLPAIRMGAQTQRADHILEVVRALGDGELNGMISGVPSQLLTLCQLIERSGKIAESVSHVVSAGAAVSPSLRKRLCEIFPSAIIYVNYGQTEASPRILCINSRDKHFHSDATGYPVGNLKTKIAEDGELLVAGDQIMLGYVGDMPNPVADGWLHTGDMASADDNGLVTVHGRKDFVVKVGGKKVALSEVEAALVVLPGISAAMVTTVASEEYGNALYALLVPESKPLKFASLVTMLSKVLETHCIPSRFYQVTSLPTNANGKLDRSKVDAVMQNAQRIL